MKLPGNNPQLIIPQGVMTPNRTISEISSSLVITHKDVSGFATKTQGYSPERSYARLLGTLTSGRVGSTVEHITQTRRMRSLLKTEGLGHVWKAVYNACGKMEHLT